MKKLLVLIVVALAVCFIADDAFAGKGKRGWRGGGWRKVGSYYLIKITDIWGIVSFKVCTENEVKAWKAKLENDYNKAKKEWKENKKKAEKDGEEGINPEPFKPDIEILAEKISLEHGNNLKKKYEKEQERKEKAREREREKEEAAREKEEEESDKEEKEEKKDSEEKKEEKKEAK